MKKILIFISILVFLVTNTLISQNITVIGAGSPVNGVYNLNGSSYTFHDCKYKFEIVKNSGQWQLVIKKM